MRVRSSRVLVFVVLLHSAIPALPSPNHEAQSQEAQSEKTPVQVLVERDSPPLSTFMGLGVEFDPYEFPPAPARWQTVLDRVTYMHPGFFRVMSNARDYCAGLDASGNPIYVWQHPDQATQKRLDNLLAILDYAQARSIDVYLGEWSPPHDLGIHSPSDPRWPRLIADFVQYLVQKRHYTVIHHYIFFNEPNGPWMWANSHPNYSAWVAGVKALRHELDTRGLSTILLAGPDNSSDTAWFASSVRDLASQFGAWEIHMYATDAEVDSAAIEADLKEQETLLLAGDPDTAHKPRFIGESGLQDGKDNKLDQQPRVRTFSYGVIMADYVAQVARAGWMGVNAWDLDDAMHANGHGGLKVWGFWDSSAASDMAIRPWFYTWSLMSRLFPKGASILSTTMEPEVERFTATASHWNSKSGQETTVMLVNDDDAPRSVVIRVPGTKPTNLHIYRYFDNDRPVNSEGFPKLAKTIPHADLNHGIAVEMPSRGVVFLTTAQL